MVLFDFGNVIARIDNRWFISRLLPDSPADPAEFVRKIFIESPLSRDFETGNSSFQEFKQGVEDIVQKKFSDDFFISAYCDIFPSIPETFDLIAFLKGKARIGMLSNTNPLHFEKVISKIPLFDLFDQITISCEVGAMKPAPEIYRDALKKYGKPPETVLYLDDIPAFAEAARTQGLQALVYDRPADICALVKKSVTQKAD